jgi:hypothetical protein
MGTIYRVFPYYYNENIIGHYGQIQIDIYEGNYLQIVIDGFLENIIQITVLAEYPKSQENNLYNITHNILVKLSNDLYYDSFDLVIPIINKDKMADCLQQKHIQSAPIDMIVYCKTGISPPENPPNQESSLYGMPFAIENMNFLNINARDDTFDEDPDIKISIDENGDFDCAEFSQHLLDNYANDDDSKVSQ